MTIEVDILTFGILIVLIIIAAVLLPAIWQFKKTTQEADALLKDLRRELSPAMRDLAEIMERTKRISLNVEKGTEKTESLLDSLEEIASSLRHASEVLRRDLGRYAEMASYAILGLKAASKVLSQGTTRKEHNP